MKKIDLNGCFALNKIAFPYDLRIHTWGGLGSQLFGVALAIDLMEKFPRRKIIIKHHSSGVSQRSLEVERLFPEFKFSYKDDYRPKAPGGTIGLYMKPFRTKLFYLVRVAANFLGFVSFCNTNLHFHQIRAWTFSIRGHYSHRKIKVSTLKAIYSKIDLTSIISRKHQLVIHYRLGDLTDLDNKSEVSINRLKRAMGILSSQKTIDSVSLLSDSPEMAKIRIESIARGDFKVTALDANAQDSILIASKSNFFLGTNSKLSVWAALFRLINNPPLPTLLPLELYKHFDGYDLTKYSISFYS